MRTYDQMNYHPAQEQLVKVLMQKTQNSNPMFFRLLVSYYFAKAASMMWCDIKTLDRGNIPVSMYALNMAPSGLGKGYSTTIIEEQVLAGFKENFTEMTFPALANINLAKLAVERSARKGTDQADELISLEKEFADIGPLLFSFNSATTPAIKEMRHKLLLANCGSMNLEIDEIGSNLLQNTEAFSAMLELYDVGRIKQKLKLSTKDNRRNEEIDGRTPTNLMCYGTQSKLFDGGRIEDEFNSLLSTGYGRRFFFGITEDSSKMTELSVDEVFAMRTDTSSSTFLVQFNDDLKQLANANNFNKLLLITEANTKLLIEYNLECIKKAKAFGDHEDTRKAEMEHRYFKVLKLAGAYAFIDQSAYITEENIYQAIKLAEDSGECFEKILHRERPYVRLAKYLSTVGRKVTQADLVEDLPFYTGHAGKQRDLMTLATAYGHDNNIVIKKSYVDDIEFFQGESLDETDTNNMIISYSTDVAHAYINKEVEWDKLHKLMKLPDYHWVNHHLLNGHRNEENCKQGFNLITLDVDSGVPLQTAKLLLADYKCLFYTTKRHTEANNRYRIVMPINYTLKMDAEEYKEFMNNVYEWLPFDVDRQTNQRARKWLTNPGDVTYNDGKLLDILEFIPRTKKAEMRKVVLRDQLSLDNLQRWFVNNTSQGQRSNMLVKYALALVDSGKTIEQVQNSVLELNNKLPDSLPEAEVLSTILITAAKAVENKSK